MIQKLQKIRRWFGTAPAHTAPPDGTVLVLLVVGLFALYAATGQRVVGFEDSAGFAASCFYADIAHAPGYPLHSLLCHPFSYLPVETPARAAALFSAAAAAAAVWLLVKILYLLCGDAAVALGGGALFGVSRTFWSQATIPEVYTLNVLLFMLALLLLLQWRQQPGVLRFAALIFVCALALTNHWPLFILAAVAFLPLLWGQREWLWHRLRQPKCLGLWAAALLIGLLPYVYLYWRANNPAAFVRLPFAPTDLASLWQIISRDLISAAIDNPAGSGWSDKAGFARFLLTQTFVREIGIAGGVLIAFGMITQWRQLGTAAASALTLLFLTATVGLLLLLNFLHDEVGEQTFAPYPLLPYAAACIWAALAARRWFGKRRDVALALLVLSTLLVNHAPNDRSGDTLAAVLADGYLRTLPAGAFFPLPPLYSLLTYRQYTTDAREDVQLLPPPTPYNAYTITPGEKLYPPNTLSFDEEMAIVDAYAATNPLCYNTYIPFATPTPSREHLLFSCLIEADGLTFIVNDEVTSLLYGLALHYERTNDWQARKLVGRILTDATRSLMLIRARRQLPPQWGDLLETLSITPPGQLGLMEYLVKQPDLVLSEERVELFAEATDLNLPLLNRRQRARLLSALADSYAAVSPRSEELLEKAQATHKRAADIIPAADAPAVQAAYRFYQREEMTDALAELKAKYGADLLSADTNKIEE